MDADAGHPATPSGSGNGSGGGDSWEYKLRKYLLLLATVVATVTYSAAFNPPGGFWQDADPAVDRIAGDPIIRETSHRRYLVYFYSNATAFAFSLVLVVLLLILSVLHDKRGNRLAPLFAILRFVMVLDLLSLMGAYAAGTFRDKLTAIYSLLLLTGVVVYLVIHMVLAWRLKRKQGGDPANDRKVQMLRLRKVLMLLATFAVSVTYVAGLSAPGGFWDHAEDGHKPGGAILKGGPHDARLKAFFVCNTTSFVASLLILVMLLVKKLCFDRTVPDFELYGLITVTLLGLVAAYVAGSCREVDTTIYVSSLVCAVALCILAQMGIVFLLSNKKQQRTSNGSCLWKHLKQSCLGQDTSDDDEHGQQQTQAMEKARSLVLLLATLAAAITYQAGFNPPGGLWQSDGIGGHHEAGDPILFTANPGRYKAFYYCNSVAFVASLVAIILARMKSLHHHNALEAAMVLDLFGLIGAYAAGSCRDVSTSIYAMALAGAVLVYVVIHVVFFTLDHKEDSTTGPDQASLEENEKLVEKRRKRLLLFAILAVTITYQAGLTPPSGFLLKDDQATGHLAGDPILLYNYPRRYKAFFYCNSVSFMLSIALIILLVNPNLYRPAIRSNALSVCTAAGWIGIVGGYAAGCTQHLTTSFYVFALAVLVLCSVALMVALFFVTHLRELEEEEDKTATAESAVERAAVENSRGAGQSDDHGEKRLHAKRKYLMLLGILAASVTYQAGLAPPGGTWQSNDATHTAGDPVMHDNRRLRYLAFFYSNSTSFVASVVVIVLLLPPSLHEKKPWWLEVMNATIVLDLLGLLIAYAAGSSRTRNTSVKVSALVVAVLAYFAIHVVLSCFSRRRKKNAPASATHPNEEVNSGHQPQI